MQTHKQTLAVNGKNIRITIPVVVENGQTIKISGHGGVGRNGGPAGDLLITFVIKDDPNFKRNGKDLHTTIPVDLYTAVLGGDHCRYLKRKGESQDTTRNAKRN